MWLIGHYTLFVLFLENQIELEENNLNNNIIADNSKTDGLFQVIFLTIKFLN